MAKWDDHIDLISVTHGSKDVVSEDKLKDMNSEDKLAAKTGLRANVGKPRWQLIDMVFLRGLLKLLEFGAIKYAPNNWRKGLIFSETVDSIERHLDKWKSGEEIDSDSGCHHLDCVGFGVMVLRRQTEEKDGRYRQFDDRKIAYDLPV